MKVTPLNPQFVVGTPEATEEERPATGTEPHLRVVPAEESASTENPESPLDQETQSALRRLSRFIQDRKKKNLRAFIVYDQVAHCLEEQNPLGQILDEEA